MSIMSKYVASATMVNRQQSAVQQKLEMDTSTTISVQSQVESRWWRWQWLSQKLTAERKSSASSTRVLGHV